MVPVSSIRRSARVDLPWSNMGNNTKVANVGLFTHARVVADLKIAGKQKAPNRYWLGLLKFQLFGADMSVMLHRESGV